MTDISPRTALLHAFGAAIDADLALSPMIVVGGADEDSPWTDGVLDLATACGIYSPFRHSPMDEQSIAEIARWASTPIPHDDGMRCIALEVQGLCSDHLLQGALEGLRDHGRSECIVVIVVDPDQLDETRATVRQTLGVHQALVPFCWQGIYPSVREIQVLGEVTLVRSTYGRFKMDAQTRSPYRHDFEIDVDPGTMDVDEAWNVLERPGGSFDFAALAAVIDGRLVAKIDNITSL